MNEDMKKLIEEIERLVKKYHSENMDLAEPGAFLINYSKPILTALRAADALRKAAQATLMFHDPSPWTESRRNDWFNITQLTEATTKGLCDVQHAALAASPSSAKE